uniref:Uncharacterized protein n=1 Tax=Lotus japonicus TaxID=34305 RepID=I3SKV0_LOTJA|nr:unknown [Lotus japonicus]
MGLPTTQGKTEVGKFSPAKPHFTYPVPLSHTTTFLLSMLLCASSSSSAAWL